MQDIFQRRFLLLPMLLVLSSGMANAAPDSSVVEPLSEIKRRADFLFFQGHLKEAKRLYQRYLERSPEATEVKRAYLNVLMKLNENTQAIEILRQLMLKNPDDLVFSIALSSLLKKEGRLDEAIDVLEKTLTREPKSAPLHTALGFNYLDKGRVEEADREFQAAQKNEGRTADHLIGLAIVSFKKKNYAQAENYLEQAMKDEKKSSKTNKKASPLSLVVDELRGHIKLAQGDEKKALEHYTSAVEGKSKSAGIHSSLGNIHFKNGRYEDSEKSFRKAIQLQEQTSEHYYSLAMVLEKQERFLEAASYIELGVSHDKNKNRAFAMLQLANKFKKNDFASATKYGADVQKLKPAGSKAYFGIDYNNLLEDMITKPRTEIKIDEK